MIDITLEGMNNLNTSLQVGDLIYATATETQAGAEDAQNTMSFSAVSNKNVGVGTYRIVGMLREIQNNINEDNTVTLTVDDNVFNIDPIQPATGMFLMFSKFSQMSGDLIGYYAQAKFVNNSKEKAELFSVGSEIVVNSK